MAGLLGDIYQAAVADPAKAIQGVAGAAHSALDTGLQAVGVLPQQANSSGYNPGTAPEGMMNNLVPGSAINPQNFQTNQGVQQTTNATNQEAASVQALLRSIQAEEQANAPGVAPSLNLNAIRAQSQSQAQAAVNPLYTQYLNEYNQSLAQNEAAAQSENTNNIQGEQNTLQNTLAQNAQAQLYAGQQNASTQGNINAQAQNYQLQAGNAETAKQAAIAGQIGSGNLGASGIGAQQLWQAENTRNIADAAQQGQFQYQRNTSNLSTQDTFAQLAQSSLYAQEGATTSENATNFNLSDYLRQSAANDTAYTQALAAQQQEAIASTTQNYEAQAVQNQIQKLTGGGGKNFAAAEQAYSPYLQTSQAPSMINATNYLSGPNANNV